MGYTTGWLKDRVCILNRDEAKASGWGRDGGGIEWRRDGYVWASVDWAKGKGALNAGALDVYGVVLVRMRWNCLVNERSRIVHGRQTYQVIGETFHADRQANTVQFQAQRVVDDKG